MNIEWLGPLPESNFSETRFGSPVTLIVDHWMASSFDAALAHFRNPAAKVSAHFLVGRDGRIGQVVALEDTAYHCGNFDKNTLSIGIEHEASPTMAPTDELYVASAWLHRILAEQYGLDLVVGVSVLPHRSIVPTQCPGTLDLDRIVREAQGDEMTPAQMQELKDFIAAQTNVQVQAGVAIALRQMRGANPGQPGNDAPLTVGEHINPQHAK